MVNERTAEALARIEAAARRIESAATKPAVVEDADLARRYQALHTQTRAALTELEQLIGSLER
jgi:hypothetical protein